MIDVDSIPDQVLTDIMENMETENENDVSLLSFGEAFDKFLIWNGIMGYSGMILEAIDGLSAASTIAEIREILNSPDENDLATNHFIRIQKTLACAGHRNNPTLQLVSQAMEQGFAYRALALIKIKEILG